MVEFTKEQQAILTRKQINADEADGLAAINLFDPIKKRADVELAFDAIDSATSDENTLRNIYNAICFTTRRQVTFHQSQFEMFERMIGAKVNTRRGFKTHDDSEERTIQLTILEEQIAEIEQKKENSLNARDEAYIFQTSAEKRHDALALNTLNVEPMKVQYVRADMKQAENKAMRDAAARERAERTADANGIASARMTGTRGRPLPV